MTLDSTVVYIKQLSLCVSSPFDTFSVSISTLCHCGWCALSQRGRKHCPYRSSGTKQITQAMWSWSSHLTVLGHLSEMERRPLQQYLSENQVRTWNAMTSTGFVCCRCSLKVSFLPLTSTPLHIHYCQRFFIISPQVTISRPGSHSPEHPPSSSKSHHPTLESQTYSYFKKKILPTIWWKITDIIGTNVCEFTSTKKKTPQI